MCADVFSLGECDGALHGIEITRMTTASDVHRVGKCDERGIKEAAFTGIDIESNGHFLEIQAGAEDGEFALCDFESAVSFGQSDGLEMNLSSGLGTGEGGKISGDDVCDDGVAADGLALREKHGGDAIRRNLDGPGEDRTRGEFFGDGL